MNHPVYVLYMWDILGVYDMKSFFLNSMVNGGGCEIVIFYKLSKLFTNDLMFSIFAIQDISLNDI